MENPGQRITGGTVTDPDEFPWMVALEMTSKLTNKIAGIKCGGSLITDQHVLTAAHCIDHVEFVIYRAWLGAWNVKSDDNCYGNRCGGEVQKVLIEKAIKHNFFDSRTFFNDIGLLKLLKRVEFNEYVKPICLPGYIYKESEEVQLTVSGWGSTENQTTSDVKLKVKVPITSDEECIKLLKYYKRNFTANQLCVGGEVGKDSCQGDSGGPLMRTFYNKWYQVGLVSYGVKCAEDIPAVYTKVYKYIPWIEQTVVDLSGDSCQTPNKENGICIPVHRCEVINDALNSVCGANEGGTLVCCGSVGFPKFNIPDSPTLVPNTTTTSKSKLKVPLASLSDSSICGTENPMTRIFGSVVAEPNEFPWTVALEMKWEKTNNTAGIRCGGSLISHQYVLTAARCIKKFFQFVIYRVWLGAWNIASQDNCYAKKCAEAVLKVEVKKAIAHSLFHDKNVRKDIGLLKLKHRVEFTEFIKPICLPALEFAGSEDGARLTVVGWSEGGDEDGVKQKLEMLKVSTEECTNFTKWSWINQHISDKLCASVEPGKGLCGNNLGAPLMRKLETGENEIRWYQEAIYWGGNECGGDYPNIFTKINEHMSWIANIIKEEESPAT